jgi:hypothetical protein
MSDRKIIAVVGTTAPKGRGLVQAILNDPDGGFAVRPITRDAGKPALSQHRGSVWWLTEGQVRICSTGAAASISRTSSGSISPLRANQCSTRVRTCSAMTATAFGVSSAAGRKRTGSPDGSKDLGQSASQPVSVLAFRSHPSDLPRRQHDCDYR